MNSRNPGTHEMHYQNEPHHMAVRSGKPISSATHGDVTPAVRRPQWAYCAAVFSLAFMGLHVYWAVGGTWGLPPSALENAEATRAANWVVSAMLLIGAAGLYALTRPIGRRLPSWMTVTPFWAAASVCVSHAVFGFVTKSLYLGGMHSAVDFPEVQGMSAEAALRKNRVAAVHDLLVFEPCFLLQGVLIALAVGHFIRTPERRRLWWISLAVGIGLIDILGVILVWGGNHFAVG